MARAHGTGPDGVALDLIGQPLHLRPGPASGVRFETENTMTKATRDGVYTLGEGRFLMRAGYELPPGAVVEPTPEELELERLRLEAALAEDGIEGEVVPGTEGIELGPSDGENVTAVAEGDLADGIDLTETLIDPDDLPEEMRVEKIEPEATGKGPAPENASKGSVPETKAKK